MRPVRSLGGLPIRMPGAPKQRLPGVLSYELAPCPSRPSKDGNNLIARLPSTACSHLSCTLINSSLLIPNLWRL